MLNYVYGHDKVVAKFVASMFSQRDFDDKAKAIGVVDENGRLIGGAVFHNYDPEAGIIEISGAATSPRWLTRRTMQRIFDYAFNQCGCQMVVQRSPADDEHVLGQLAKFGYTFVRVPRLYGRHRDGVICMLTAEDWAEHRFNTSKQSHLILEEAA